MANRDWDGMIDNLVESAQELENEHEHRGFYIDSIKKKHEAYRTALREAIAEVEKRAEKSVSELDVANNEILSQKTELAEANGSLSLYRKCFDRALRRWQKDHPDAGYWPDGADNIVWLIDKLSNIENANAELERRLAEANADAERLANQWVVFGQKCCSYCGAPVRWNIDDSNPIAKHAPDCPIELHRARLVGKEQG